MQYFKQIGRVNPDALLASLLAQPELFDRYKERRAVRQNGDGSPIQSPHKDMTDIWVRHNDRTAFDAGTRPWSQFNDPHDAVWYPDSEKLADIRFTCLKVQELAGGGTLGGVLITKLRPGKGIEPHTDHGWHAEAHRKFMVFLQSDKGSVFGFPDPADPQRSTVIDDVQPGDVYEFRNDIPHWIVNASKRDRIVVIISIRDLPDAEHLLELPRKIIDPALLDAYLDVEHHFLPGMYVKRMRIKAGGRVGKHLHDYDHASLLASGRVAVHCTELDGSHNVTVYTGRASMLIRANVAHEIEALDESVWYCIHATDETDPTKIDDALTGH